MQGRKKERRNLLSTSTLYEKNWMTSITRKNSSTSHISGTQQQMEKLFHMCGINITPFHTQKYLVELHVTLPLRLEDQERLREIGRPSKATRLGSVQGFAKKKAKKQAVVSAAYSRKRSEARRANAQKAGELWNDDDFTWCKIDHYCTGSIVKRVREPIQIFGAYKEEWEKVQFDRKGDDIHVAKLSAKYGGLKYIDTEDPSKIGTFQDHFCEQLNKYRKNVTREQRIQGKGWFYTLVGVYEGFDKELSLESQEEFVDTWEREWDTYEMIFNYYDKFPNPK